MEQSLNNRFAAVRPLIGHTPLLEIDYTFCGKPRRLFAKAEYYNLTGSIKDRVALYILEKAYKNGTLHPGDTIAEATSGNTGISFSALGRYLGHPVTIYMPNWMSRERIALMESFGATVHLVSAEEGGFLGSIKMTEMLAEKGNVFLPRQFSNEDNTMAHVEGTAAEIIEQLESCGLVPHGVVAGVGTGGTIMGLARGLRMKNPSCKAFPLEPANSPTLSTGYKTGKHRIYGISDEFIPDIVKLDELDKIVSVDDGDAICMARLLSETLGVGVGVSGGANFLGCVLAQEILGKDAVLVTVFADDNKKYLSTDYAIRQHPQPDSLTAAICLKGMKAIH
ncbi:MAG: cysteine synthase family protein [Ruminococcaceae bacterium]|nr:cysteine synthase family protein [Oscillospiraceae bacterium]